MQRRYRRSLLTLLLALSPAAGAESISEIYRLALENDAQLKAAEAVYRADRESARIARSALLPQISGSYSYSDTDAEFDKGGFSSSTGTFGNSTQDIEAESTTFNLTLNQALFDLGAWFDYQSGRSMTKQARAKLAAEQQDLIVRTAQAYFDVLKAQSNLEASRAEERATRRQLEQTQQRFDVGLIAITDVHEARASYDQTKVRRLSDEGTVATALENLSVLTNRSHSKLQRLSEGFKVSKPVPLDRNAWVEFALKHNHRLRASRYAMDSAQLRSKGAKAKHLPTVGGSVVYSDSDDESSVFLDPAPGGSVPNPLPSTTEGPSTTVAFEVRVPIFTGGRTSAQRRQAAAQYEAARQQNIGTQRQTVTATRAQHIAVLTDVERVKARKQAIVSTRSALDATRAGYQVGTRNVVDVLNAQRALYASIRDYNNARHDYIINTLKLKQQAGTLSPQDILELDKWLTAASAGKNTGKSR